jgi:D-alanine-D-alanine ligase
MDKALTKRIARDAGIRTAPFELYHEVPPSPPFVGFPVFVKPNCDGSSRGIYSHSHVTDMDSLRKQIGVILNDYNQPALVEPYLDGRDFCNGLLWNNPQCTLTTCEVLLGHEKGIPFFSYEYKCHDIDRLDLNPSLDSVCISEMEEMARTAFRVLGCLDYARIDFRTDRNGIPYLLEVNALPGLSPTSGIFVKQAAAFGLSYEMLILKILERIFKT